MEEEHDIALWAGAVAFFSSLLAIGIFDVFEPDQWVEYIGALLVAFITAGSIYAKLRYDDAVTKVKNKVESEDPNE